MNEISRGAAELQDFCLQREWRFCIIGDIAVQRWADPRQTEGADITLLAGFSGEEAFVDSLLTAFRPRHSNEREMALLRRIVFLY